jgi:hypothetical protein
MASSDIILPSALVVKTKVLGLYGLVFNFCDKALVKEELVDMRDYTAAICAVWADYAIKVYEDVNVCCAAGAVT